MAVRTCLTCGGREEKNKLLKFVLESTKSQTQIVGDFKKSKSGRGYYLHRSVDCLTEFVGWKKMVGKANGVLAKSEPRAKVIKLDVDGIRTLLGSFAKAVDLELDRIVQEATKELEKLGEMDFLVSKKNRRNRTKNLFMPSVGNKVK